MFLATFATAEYNQQKKGEEVCQANDDDDDDCEDELARDDRLRYKAQVSKWVAGALAAMKSQVFWLFLHVCHHAREPVRHLFNILSKYASWQSSKAFRDATPAAELPIVDLITTRIPQLDLKFRQLASSVGEWTHPILSDILNMHRHECHSDDLDAERVRAIALRIVLQNHTAFTRRIAELFNRQGLQVTVTCKTK